MSKPRRRLPLWLVLAALVLLLTGCTGAEGATKLSLSLDGQDPRELTTAVQLLLLLTVLSLVPAILIMATSFTRIIIVLSLLRSAIGAPMAPPNQVLLGLALFLTFFVMSPVINTVNERAYQPYANGEISRDVAIQRAVPPVRDFLLRQTREKDVALFVEMAKLDRPNKPEDVPIQALLPAFVVSELRTAFQMGVVIFVPFLVIDMVVSSVLMSMGMMMLPPAMVSLPFKLLLFVLVDGWHLTIKSLVASFM